MKQKLKIFRGIGSLFTLQGAALKKGRKITEADLSIINNACLVCDSGLIKWVGRRQDLPRSLARASVRDIDCAGATVLPAFVESHTHLVFAGSRSAEFEMRNCGFSYQQIAERGGGIISTVNKTRKTSLDELVAVAQKRVDEFVRQGVTAIEIKSGYALDEKNEIKMLKAAAQLKHARIIPTFLGAHALPPEYKGNPEGYIEFLITKILPKIARAKLAKRVDMFIESGYFNCDHAKAFFGAAQQLGFAISAHVEQLTYSGGTSFSLGIGAQSVDHVVQIKDLEIEALANSQSTAVLLPGADFYLKMAYPPARRLIDAGARVALASDFNPGTCPTQDISFIGLLARMNMQMSLPEVLTAYTLNAAYALGLENEVGSLEPGKIADFIVLDDEWTKLFYEVGHSPVCEVWHKAKKLL